MAKRRHWSDPLVGDTRFVGYCPAAELDDSIRGMEESMRQEYPENEIATFTRQVVPGLPAEGDRVYVLWGSWR